MASSVLRDLQQLNLMFDSPAQYSSPAAARKLGAASLPGQPGYAYALHSAEKSVDRLGHAIEEAEAEMEAALRRTTDVHKSQLRQKELEVAELQRVVAAKERSIESVRDTLATTQRTYEGRLGQSEAVVGLRDAEIRALQDELRTVRLERDSFEVHLHREAAAAAGTVARLRDAESAVREQDTQAAVAARQREQEAAAAHGAFKQERLAKEVHREECDELRRRVDALNLELQCAHADSASLQARLEQEADELRRGLKTERHLRRACETWLRSELRSREEMDALLGAIKDSASASSEPEALQQQQMVLMQLQEQLAASGESLAAAGGGWGAHQSGLLRGGGGSPSRRVGRDGSPRGSVMRSGGSRHEVQHRRHERQVAEVQGLLDTLRHSSPVRERPSHAAAMAASAAAEAGALSRQLDADNQVLKAELGAARKLLADRLRRS